MTFYGLSCVFLTQPQLASLQQHSGYSCSWHVGLFGAKKHFFGSTSLQTPVWHLSWRSQPICDCLVEMDLNYSSPSCSFAYEVLMWRNRRVPFFVWSEPLAWQLWWDLLAPFPNGLLCLGLSQTFWPALPSISGAKWKGEKKTHTNISCKPDFMKHCAEPESH